MQPRVIDPDERTRLHVFEAAINGFGKPHHHAQCLRLPTLILPFQPTGPSPSGYQLCKEVRMSSSAIRLNCPSNPSEMEEVITFSIPYHHQDLQRRRRWTSSGSSRSEVILLAFINSRYRVSYNSLISAITINAFQAS